MIQSFILQIEPELLSEIFEWLPIDDGLSTTASVSLVCRYFARIAEPLRLRSMTISSSRRLWEVLETLRVYEHRQAYVRELFLFDFPDDSIPDGSPEVCYPSSGDFLKLLYQVSSTLSLLSFTIFHSFSPPYPLLFHKLLLTPLPSLTSLSLRLLCLPPLPVSKYSSLSTTLPSLCTLHLSVKMRYQHSPSFSSAKDDFSRYLGLGVEGVASSSEGDHSEVAVWDSEVHVVAKVIGVLPRLENLMVSGSFDYYTFCIKLGMDPYEHPSSAAGSPGDRYRPTVAGVMLPNIQLPPNLKRIVLQQYWSTDYTQPFSSFNADGRAAGLVNDVPAMEGIVFLESIECPTREVWRMLARFGGNRAVGASDVTGVFEMRTFGALFDCVSAI